MARAHLPAVVPWAADRYLPSRRGRYYRSSGKIRREDAYHPMKGAYGMRSVVCCLIMASCANVPASVSEAPAAEQKASQGQAVPTPLPYESWDGAIPVTAQAVLFMGVDSKPDRSYVFFADLALGKFLFALDAPSDAQANIEAMFQDQVPGGLSVVSLLKGPIPCCIPPVGQDAWAIITSHL
jgi:hypothetical protein